MTRYRPGDVVRIVTNRGEVWHGFKPGTFVTLDRIASTPSREGLTPRWQVYGPNPRKPGSTLSQTVAEGDFTPETLPHTATAPDREAEWFAALPTAPTPAPVQVLGDFWKLASDRDLELALGGLRFELTERAKEMAT